MKANTRSPLLFACAALAALVLSVTAAQAETPAQRDARLAWWREARFGMFIHYGPVSLTGREISWSRANSNTNCPNKGPTPVAVYDNLYREFNPTNFHAADWTGVARAAGMRYVVLTAKHCDGFLLWDSEVDPYNIRATPFRRDLCGELAMAARADGLKLGWYFSPMDWRDPDFRTGRNRAFLTRMQGQLRELLSNYGVVDLLWFDHDGREAGYDQPATYSLVKGLQPRIIINNRLDLGVGQGNTLMLSPHADYYTPEQRIGGYDDQRPWETCMTLGRQWSWKPNDDVKSLQQCIQTLVTCVAGDGNLLLNVGPMPDGRIEPRQVERLKEMGAWLAEHGESIYGTRGGPWKPTSALGSTREGSTVYLHLLREEDGVVQLPALPRKVIRASLLGGGRVNCAEADGKLQLTFDPAAIDSIDTIVRLELDGSAMDIPAMELASDIKARASNVYQKMHEQYGPQEAFDNDPHTRWATDSGTKQAWIAADLGKPLTLQRVRIEEALAERVQKFEFQYREGAEWKTIFTGQKIGRWFQQKVEPPVKAQEFRLNILDATDGPTLSDIEFIEK